MTTLNYTTCTKITRRDAMVEGYTSFHEDLTVDAQLYRSTAAYTPTGATKRSDLRPDTIDIGGIIDGVYLVEQDLLKGLYDGATISVIVVDWSNSTKVSSLLDGFLGAVSIENSQYSIQFNSLEIEYGKQLGRAVGLRCTWDLGDSNCGYSLSSQSGTVTMVGSPANRVFADNSRTEADGFYNGGKVTWTSGNNAGCVMDVKVHTAATDTIELYEPMPYDIVNGNAYTITRGCDKTFETCRDTFSNVVPASGKGFGGFPYIPGFSDIVGKRNE